MCEGYLKFLREKSGRENLEIESAGTFAGEGQPPSGSSLAVMKARGIDISGHRSSPLTAEKLESSDLVVAMTNSHRLQIGKILPSALKKTRLIMEFADKAPADVSDPYGGNLEDYTACFDQLKPALDNLFLDLAKMFKS